MENNSPQPEQSTAQSLSTPQSDGKPEMIDLKPANVPNDQIRRAYDKAVDKGYLTRDEADLRLRDEHGLAPKTEPARNDFEAHFDRVFKPAEDHEFYLGEVPNSLPASERAAMKEAQDHFRKWLGPEGAGFPLKIGNAIVETLNQESRQMQMLTPSQRDSGRAQQVKNLKQIWGDKFDANVKVAQEMISKIESKSPGLIRYLESTGAGNSAMVAKMVFDHAQRLKVRNGGK